MEPMKFDSESKNTDIIKSAFELAMEKLKSEPVEAIDSDAQSNRDIGRKLAASFLKDPKLDLKKELNQYAKQQKEDVADGAQEVLMLNIILPHNEQIKKECRRALEGIGIVQGLSPQVLELLSQIEQVCSEYLKTIKQYFTHLKQEFKEQASMVQQQAAAQLGTNVRVDPEHLPDFQKKWHELKNQIDEQYETALQELKKQLLSSP